MASLRRKTHSKIAPLPKTPLLQQPARGGSNNTSGNGNSGVSNPVPPVTPAQASALRQSGLAPSQLDMLQRIGKNGSFNLKMMPKNALDSYNNYISKGQKVPGCIKGGEGFQNKEGKLPATDLSGKPIEYKEWDFNPANDPKKRGLERIITGSDGRKYYTPDHYETFYPF